MGDQSASASTSTMLWPTNFSRSGYGFAGWSDQFDYQLGSNANTGHIYGPMESITTPADMSEGLSLYAVWVSSTGNLQNWTGCSSLASGAVTALTDTRDNNTYTVAKLADNKCWMVENLRLADKTSSNTAIELTNLNTNNPSLPITNVYDATNPTTSNSLSVSQDPTQTAWCTSSNANCDDQSMLFTGNTTNSVVNMTALDASTAVYSYGNYYNWYSVTVTNGKYSNNTNNQSVSGDICPTGWRLPQGGNKTRIESDNDNDFWNLIVDGLNNGTKPASYGSQALPAYGDNGSSEAIPIAKALRSFPNNFLYSGYINGSSISYRGSMGDYWSSTARNNSYAYRLELGSTRVYPGTSAQGYKYWGIPARCIASN